MRLSRVAVFNRSRVYLFPLVMYSFKPSPSFSLSPLDGLYQVYHDVHHSSSSLEYDDPCLFSCTYILGSRDVGVYFPALCASIKHDACMYVCTSQSMPQESIDWDHSHSKVKTLKPPCMQSPKSQCQNHVFTAKLQKLRCGRPGKLGLSKKRYFLVLFRTPLFLSKWYGVAIYFLYKK